MYESKVISKQEYKTLKNLYNEYHKQREILCQGRNYVTAEEQKLLPECPTSEQISSLEVYEFVNDPPKKYFAYVHRYQVRENLRTYPDNVTTWTGEVLGRVIDFGRPYKTNMGDERINIRVKAINGKEYFGTYYKSSGDYCRLTMKKA